MLILRLYYTTVLSFINIIRCANRFKFHQYHPLCLHVIWTDGQGDSYIPPQTLFVGGLIK